MLGLVAANLAGVATVRAQTIPPLQASIAPQGGGYDTSANTSDGYARIRVTGDGTAAYTWIRGALKATLLDENGNECVGANQTGFPELSQSSVSLGSALAAVLGSSYTVSSEYSGAAWLIDTTFDVASQNLARMLTANGALSGTAVLGSAAMLAPSAEPTMPVVLDYEATANHGWRLDSDGTMFNLDALFQVAVYETVQPSLGGQGLAEFFDDPDTYGKICGQPVRVGVTMVGVRDHAIAAPFNPPPVDPTLPSLLQTGHAPKLAKSNRVFLMHGGTNQSVPPPLHLMAIGNQVPIYTVPANHVVVMHASGFTPGMQVAVCAENSSFRMEASVHWSDFGKVAMTVSGIPSGFHRIKYYRRIDPAGNGTTYTNWQLIPVNLRPRIFKS